MFKRVFHFNGVILSLFAALWIITGSTVIFHQKYVYHNLLTNWQDVFLKPGLKDTKKYVKFIDKSQQTIHTGSCGAIVENFSGLYVFGFTNKNFNPWFYCELKEPGYIFNQPHRGPPVI